jgi:hypothetical protein
MLICCRQLADACLREPLAEQPALALVSWREDVRRIWASGPRPEYRYVSESEAHVYR